MKKKVLVPVADGTEEIEAVSIIDILRRAGAEVTVASVGDQTITASRGVVITADCRIQDCRDEKYDLIALPGGIPGAENLRDSETLIELLKRHRRENGTIGAICAAPAVVLHHHGLIENRKATCHPSFASRLPNKESIDSRVVIDGNVATSRGPGTAIEFALFLVELLYGRTKANEVAAPMVIGPPFDYINEMDDRE